MTLSLQEVEHIAKLARLALSDAEKALYASQLSSILEYAARLQMVDTSGIQPTSSGSSSADRLRDDEPGPSMDIETLFMNAPEIQKQQFRVPPVFD